MEVLVCFICVFIFWFKCCIDKIFGNFVLIFNGCINFVFELNLELVRWVRLFIEEDYGYWFGRDESWICGEGKGIEKDDKLEGKGNLGSGGIWWGIWFWRMFFRFWVIDVRYFIIFCFCFCILFYVLR